MTPEDWRYVGATALGIAGVSVWALGYRTLRRAPPRVQFGDPNCSLAFYQGVLGQHGSNNDESYRAWYYAPVIIAAARHFGVPADVMMGIGHTESRFVPTAGSSAGARGLMQFMPKTAAGVHAQLVEARDWPFGALDRNDPQQSAWMAGALMRQLLRNRSLDYALAAYNAGGGRVPSGMPFEEWPDQTQAYVPAVIRRAGYYREIWERCHGLASA